MKATLTGQYNGGGGKQDICIKGDLTVEGLSSNADLLSRIEQLEAHLVKLENVVSRLQEQNMHSTVGQLAKALEEVKPESVVETVETSEPSVVQESVQEEPVVKSSSKKKTSST
jgi:hypothetical protein